MYEKSLSLTGKDLSEVEVQEIELVKTMNKAKAEILEINRQHEGLKRQLAELHSKEDYVNSSLRRIEEDLSKIQQDATKKKEKVS